MNGADHRGDTALMHAVHDPKLFDTPLSLGADPHQTNAAGHSAHTRRRLTEPR